jgi:peptide/nickel transport system permease protein
MRLVAWRTLASIPTVLAITVVAFALAAFTPGDPAAVMLQRQTGEAPSDAAVAALRRTLGLDDPLPVRYVRWLGAVARGDLGTSYRTGGRVTTMLGERARQTVLLATVAIGAAVFVGVPCGLVAAAFQRHRLDPALRLAVVLGESWPNYVVAYLLIVVFGVWLRWLPVAGGDTWAHVVLPATTLAIGLASSVVRLTRSGVLDAMRADFATAARARGASSRHVLVRHAWPAGALLLLAFAGARVASLLGGAVVVETVFAWPGLGQALVTAVFDRDYPVIQALVLYAGVVLVGVNLAADMTLLWLDPRARVPA